MSRLPLVRLEGGPREWGLQHGTAAKSRVAHNVRAYLHRFREDGGLSASDVRERAEAYREVIERTNPDYADAVSGIAEGSRQDLLDVVAVNARYEIMYSEFVRVGMERELAGPSAVGGCTAFAVLPEHTANGHLLVGQNWDWIPESEGLVVHATDDRGMRTLAFTEAGIAGAKIGLNSEGLALAINGLMSDQDRWSHLRRPFHVRCWEILKARTIEVALRSVTDEPRSCSANFLLAKAGPGGRVVDIEAAPDGVCELAPADGFLVHTNHFADPEKLGIVQPLAEDRESTYHRQKRLAALIHDFVNRRKPVGVADLKRMLRDHEGGVLSVCRHPDPSRPANERFETRVSVVMDVDAGELYLAPGNPCTARFRRYSIDA